MEIYKDATGMFEDFCFKLVVIDALLAKSPDFEKDLEALKEKYVNNFVQYSEPRTIMQVIDFFSRLKLAQQDLDKVDELYFSGGNDVYFMIQPDWDGEDETFYVKSVVGFENLKNLTNVYFEGICKKEVLDPMKEKGIIVT